MTNNLITRERLALMKQDAYLINIGRGNCLDQEALVDALNENRLAGAALDVAKHEPLPEEDPLWNAANILITPHRAAYGDQMVRRMTALIERNIHHWLSGEPLEDRIL